MTILIKIILLVSLILILYQDIKQRQIWIILLPIFAITGGVLFYKSVVSELFYYSIPINLALVGILLLINYLFARFILKKSLFKEALGLGDLLFFIAFALSFPTLSFINFFVFSLLFSLVVHLVTSFFLNTRKHQNSIPLAGYMSFFLIGFYSCHWLGIYNNLYFL